MTKRIQCRQEFQKLEKKIINFSLRWKKNESKLNCNRWIAIIRNGNSWEKGCSALIGCNQIWSVLRVCVSNAKSGASRRVYFRSSRTGYMAPNTFLPDKIDLFISKKSWNLKTYFLHAKIFFPGIIKIWGNLSKLQIDIDQHFIFRPLGVARRSHHGWRWGEVSIEKKKKKIIISKCRNTRIEPKISMSQKNNYES